MELSPRGLGSLKKWRGSPARVHISVENHITASCCEGSLSTEGKAVKHLMNAKFRNCPEDEVYSLDQQISKMHKLLGVLY